MIRVILRGQLGNQLFQYAVGRHLAWRHGVPLVLNLWRRMRLGDPWGLGLAAELGHFDLQARLERTPPAWLRAREALHRSPPYRERRWGFAPEVLALPRRATLLGYFQSARYFAAIAPMLRQELRFVRPWDTPAAAALAARMAGEESVAVHVRRGDYLRSPLHRVCTPAYYARAMARLRARRPEARFYLFSDDLAGCRQERQFQGAQAVDTSVTGGDPLGDFRLMGRCRHHIIANSTFSWWPAWLAEHPEQVVLAPARWFNDDALDALACRDTLPIAWERVPV